MKTTKTILKTSMVGLFLMTGINLLGYGQTFTPPITAPESLDVGDNPDDVRNSIPVDATVLFYDPSNGGPTFTIAPSLQDENGIEFEYFRWSRVRSDGSTYDEVDISAAVNDGKYVIGPGGQEEALAPGYHVFRLLGFVGDPEGTAACPSADWQDYVVYVLPPLSVTAGLAPESSSILEYCEVDVPEGENAIILSNTDLAFKTSAEDGETGTFKAVNTDFISPIPGDFEYNYQWYSIKLDAAGNPGVRTLITGAENSAYEVALAPGQPGYDGFGTYIFEVEIKYVVKESGTRDYVTYIGRAQNAMGEDLAISITPQPGKPHITIENVND